MRIAINQAEKRFGGPNGHRALANVSLEAEEGEFLVLLGPSGSGKTTLLRAIAGLESIDGGDIQFGGRRVNDLEPGERNIGMVFQDYALYPHFTVGRNIGYNMSLRGIARADVERRVREVATMLSIEQLLERKPSELSGGQRQRVAVARAIARDASVLLMDEPLSNLDAQIREHVRVELRELQRRLGVTAIYVTHDQVEAMVMADRIAVMNNGGIEQLGAPDEIYGSPQTLFCARFVGSPKINEIAGQLRAIDANTAEFSFGDRARVTFRLGLRGDCGPDWRDAILAFRAEDATLETSAAASWDGARAEVSFVENRGAERFVIAQLLPGFRTAQVSPELRVRILNQLRPNVSEVGFLPTLVHLFDPKTGQRVGTGPVSVLACAGSRSGEFADRRLA